MSHPRARLTLLSVIGSVLVAASPATLRGQTTGTATASAAEECLGLAFGAWKPALNAVAAGHRQSGRFDTSAASRAPNDRDWALRLPAGRDTTLMLFPAWWPVGVAVRVPAVDAVGRDTLRGTATALVADGQATNPTTTVLLWRVPCRMY